MTRAAHSRRIPQARRSATPSTPTATAPEAAATSQATTCASVTTRLSGWSPPSTNGARGARNGSSPRWPVGATEILAQMRALIAKTGEAPQAVPGEGSCREVARNGLRFATPRQCVSVHSERTGAVRAPNLQRSATTSRPGFPAHLRPT